MKYHHKAVFRSVILDEISGVSREFLHDLAEWHDLDPFEVMEFYEEQFKRIDKMFNFPNSYLASLPDDFDTQRKPTVFGENQ
jgi:hypothetical protein